MTAATKQQQARDAARKAREQGTQAMAKTIWLAVQVFGEDDESRQWTMEIVGAFETEGEAIKACKAENYCIGPLTLGKVSAIETVDWPGAYYPLTMDENTAEQGD